MGLRFFEKIKIKKTFFGTGVAYYTSERMFKEVKR